MAEGNNEIRISLELDGKNYIASVTQANGTTKKFTLSAQQLQKALADNAKTVQHATGSVNDLRQRLTEAEKIFASLSPKADNYGAALKRVNVLKQHLINTTKKATVDMGKFGAASGQTGFAILNMNRIISDAPFGMIAISNNIEPMVQSFISLRNTTGGAKAAILSLGKSLIGPLGLMTAVSLVTAAVTTYALNNRGAEKTTNDFKEETEKLNEKLRLLEATYKDITQAQSNYSKEIIKTSIAEAEARIAILKKQQADKGIYVRGEFIAFSDAQLADLQSGIDIAKNKLAEYYKKLDEGSPLVKANIDLLKGLAKAANEDGVKGVENFGKANKLSERNLQNLTNTLKDYKTEISSVSGGLAKELEPGVRKFAIQLGLQRKEAISAISVLDKYWDSVNGKNKKDPKKRDTNLVKIEAAKLDLGGLTSEQNKLFKQLEQNFKANGLDWDPENQAFAYNVVLNLKENKDVNYLKGVNVKEHIPDLKLTTAELNDMEFKANLATQAFQFLGDSMIDAFTGAKLTIGEVSAELGNLILKLTLAAGIKAGLGAAFPFLIPFLAEGGQAAANMPHIVGEKGPELFIPDTSGFVVSNNQLQKLSKDTNDRMSYLAYGQRTSNANGNDVKVTVVGTNTWSRRGMVTQFERLKSYNKRMVGTFSAG